MGRGGGWGGAEEGVGDGFWMKKASCPVLRKLQTWRTWNFTEDGQAGLGHPHGNGSPAERWLAKREWRPWRIM